MKSLNILGVMTGTSCDGLDAACVRVDQGGWQPLWERSCPYPKNLRERVLRFQKSGTKLGLEEWLELNRDLGEWFGKILSVMIKSVPKKHAPHVIANHGQTIGHFPNSRGGGFTSQIADPTRIATQTGLTVVSNFRDGDMAAGGQGAPLVPLFHLLLAPALSGKGVAIHNLGGISNLTYIGPSGPRQKVLAFDTGPANIWIDAAVEKISGGKLTMDRDGELALKGVLTDDIDMKAVATLLKHPFFKKQPPKSTGRDDFPFELFLRHVKSKGPSLVSAATAVTVESIAQAYEKFILGKKLPLEAVYFCGGGAKNPVLLEWLSQRLPGIKISTLEEAGMESQYIEAQAFALFGYLSLTGKPLGGEWTGVKGFGPPGHIVPGENWDQVLSAL